ncbi:hypothetical protein [Streptomyces globosus]|uniref:hypothetical protein n=1 Tax=Streptomyces globosus TaxID=68209 RepID=UPI00363F908B
MQPVHVVAQPAAAGDSGGLAQGGGRVRVVRREPGRLLVALLGLAEQVPGEGAGGEGAGEAVGVGAVLRQAGGPGEGGPEVVGDGVEADPPRGAALRGALRAEGEPPATAASSARAAAASRDQARWRPRTPPSSPVPASRSAPYWRMVSRAW